MIEDDIDATTTSNMSIYHQALINFMLGEAIYLNVSIEANERDHQATCIKLSDAQHIDGLNMRKCISHNRYTSQQLYDNFCNSTNPNIKERID